MTAPLAAHPLRATPPGLAYVVGLLVLLLMGAVVFVFLIRRFLKGRSEPERGVSEGKLDIENPSAFAAASMQGVIEKLRTQEKELARLHLLAQERAQESERLSEEVTRNMPTGLLLVSATGAISSANPAAETALGTRSLRYRSYKEVLGETSDLTRMLSTCLREGQTFQRGEVEHSTSTGEIRRLGVTISPIYRTNRNAPRFRNEPKALGADAKASGALCLMSDLTELSALQKQIRWKENLAALGEMSAGVAHEFKNALATISGYAQMIRSEVQPGDVRDSVDRILDQTRSLTHVVTEFLRFAKPLEISYETVPMRAVVERIAQELHEAIPQCEIRFEGAFEELPGDEGLIRQALLNLVRNGAEAARDSGKAPCIAICGTVEDFGGKKWQRLSIADNGPGIAEADLPKIFLPFYTTKSEGTGLGLAVVQKVTLQHGGSIEARNRPEGGAEFLLWLPLRQEPSPFVFPSEAARI